MGRVKIVLFDMDGVLVPIKSSWAYLHEYFGVQEAARRYLEAFERGEIDYVKWMELDTSLWVQARRGGCVHIRELQDVLSRVPVNPEAPLVGRELHKRGIMIGIVSGGIDLLARRVASILGADVWVANRLLFDKRGCLRPGGIPIVGVDKVRVVRRILGEYGIEPGEAMFVGDSRWDRSVMNLVGHPVAYGDDCPLLDGVAKYRIRRLSEVVQLIDKINGGEV